MDAVTVVSTELRLQPAMTPQEHRLDCDEWRLLVFQPLGGRLATNDQHQLNPYLIIVHQTKWIGHGNR